MLRLGRIRNIVVRIVSSVRSCGENVRNVGGIWKGLRIWKKLFLRRMKS